MNAAVIEHDTGAAMTPVPEHERRQVAVTGTTPSDVLRFAMQNGADLERIEKLMDLQARWEADQARREYTLAMTKFKADPIVIEKRKLVEFRTRDGDLTSYRHAELSDVTDVLIPALANHGFSHRWDCVQEDGGIIRVKCVLTHERGHSESVSLFGAPDNSGKKNSIQQVASTITYLERYTLLMITGMATKGMDDDGRGAGAKEDDYDATDWYAAIDGAATRDDLDKIAAEIKATPSIPKSALRSIRAAWAARAKEI